MDFKEPELLVFLQENDYQIFKEICVDEEVSFHDKCCVENCEVDHSILSVLLNSELENPANLRTEAPEVVSFLSNVSESFHQHECITEVTKQYSSEALSMESNVCVGARVKYAEVSASKNLEAQTSVLFDSFIHRGDKENNQVPYSTPFPCKVSVDTISPTPMFSSTKELHNSGSAIESGCVEEERNRKTMDCESFKSAVSCIEVSTEQDFGMTEKSKAKAEDEDENPGNFTNNFHDPNDSSFPAHPSSLAYTGPVPHSATTSLGSYGSSTSRRSFEFPIMPSEWCDSPVRMAEADEKNSRKRRHWRTRFLCCNF